MSAAVPPDPALVTHWCARGKHSRCAGWVYNFTALHAWLYGGGRERGEDEPASLLVCACPVCRHGEPAEDADAEDPEPVAVARH